MNALKTLDMLGRSGNSLVNSTSPPNNELVTNASEPSARKQIAVNVASTVLGYAALGIIVLIVLYFTVGAIGRFFKRMFGKIGGAFKKAGKAMKKSVKKTGKAIKKSNKKVAKAFGIKKKKSKKPKQPKQQETYVDEFTEYGEL